MTQEWKQGLCNCCGDMEACKIRFLSFEFQIMLQILYFSLILSSSSIVHNNFCKLQTLLWLVTGNIMLS